MAVEIVGRDIPFCLLFTDIRDAHLDVHQRVGKGHDVFPFLLKGFVRLQTEIDRIGIAIVPTPTNARETPYLVVVDDLDVSSHKLLFLAFVRYGVLTQIVGHVNQQQGVLGVMDAIEGASLRGGDLRPDAILEGGGIIA